MSDGIRRGVGGIEDVESREMQANGDGADEQEEREWDGEKRRGRGGASAFVPGQVPRVSLRGFQSHTRPIYWLARITCRHIFGHDGPSQTIPDHLSHTSWRNSPLEVSATTKLHSLI